MCSYSNFTATLQQLYSNVTATLQQLYSNFTATLQQIYSKFTANLQHYVFPYVDAIQDDSNDFNLINLSPFSPVKPLSSRQPLEGGDEDEMLALVAKYYNECYIRSLYGALLQLESLPTILAPSVYPFSP